MGKYVDRKQYWAIRNEITREERKLVDFYELQWHMGKRIPTVTETAKYLEAKVTEVNYWLTRKCVQTALKTRGIPWQQTARDSLSEQQIAAAVTVMNFIDQRSIEDKLDQLGIQPATYYAWQQNPQFKSFLAELANNNLGNIRPTAITELGKKVAEGNMQAIKYYLDASGDLVNNDAPASEILLRMVIEIIQKHVKDPRIITAIAQDISLAAANKTLSDVAPPPRQVTSYVEEDEDLETAKKTLGIN